MIAYYSSIKNICVIVHIRTGSSLANTLNDLQPKIFSNRFILQDSNPLEFIRQLEEIKAQGAHFYITVKDPELRRKSALSMKTIGASTKSRTSFLHGMMAISADDTTSYLMNYCLNDNHVDWGCSVIYHWLQMKGINVQPCLLTRDGDNHYDNPLGLETYTALLYRLCRDVNDTAFKLHVEKDQKKYTQPSEFKTGKWLTLTRDINEYDRCILYETYCQQFRAYDAQKKIEPIMDFEYFLGFEQRCHNAMIKKAIHDENDDILFESSEYLMEEIHDKFFNHDFFYQAVFNGDKQYPGSSIIRLFDDYQRLLDERKH